MPASMSGEIQERQQDISHRVQANNSSKYGEWEVGAHERQTTSVSHMMYKNEINAAKDHRLDMQWFADTRRKAGEQDSCNTWVQFTEKPSWVRITQMARKFARYEVDDYNIDSMEGFIQSAAAENGQ